jgi:hypothetical protein
LLLDDNGQKPLGVQKRLNLVLMAPKNFW